ncbi:unnamed protein product, partial [Trichobilharzia regenti]
FILFILFVFDNSHGFHIITKKENNTEDNRSNISSKTSKTSASSLSSSSSKQVHHQQNKLIKRSNSPEINKSSNLYSTPNVSKKLKLETSSTTPPPTTNTNFKSHFKSEHISPIKNVSCICFSALICFFSF